MANILRLKQSETSLDAKVDKNSKQTFLLPYWLHEIFCQMCILVQQLAWEAHLWQQNIEY